MHSSATSRSPQHLVWFLGAEVVCLAGFAVSLHFGRTVLALLFLCGPIQMLVAAAVFRSNFLILSAFVLLLPLAGMRLLPSVYRGMPFYVGSLGLVGFLLMTRFVVSDLRVLPRLDTAERIGLLAVTAAVLLSAVNSSLSGSGAALVVRSSVVMLFALLATWVFAVVPRSMSQIRILLLLLVTTHAVTCLALPGFAISAQGFLVGKTVLTPFGRTNLNLLGFFIGPLAAIVLGALHDGERKWTNGLLVIVFLVLLGTLFYTRSRGAWMGFGLAFLYVLVRVRSFKLLVFAAVAAAVLLSMDILRFAVQARVEQTGVQDPAMLGRLVLWKAAWETFRANWLLGVGAGRFRLVKFSYGFPVLLNPRGTWNAHSLYLEMLASLGLVGGLGFIWLLTKTFLRLDRVARGFRSFRGRGLVVGLGAGLVAYSVQGIVESCAWDAPSISLCGVLLGLSIAAARLARNEDEAVRRDATTACGVRAGGSVRGAVPADVSGPEDRSPSVRW